VLPVEVTDLLGRQFQAISHHQLRERLPDPLERAEVRRRLDLRPITSRVLGQPVHDPGPGRRLITEVLDAGPEGWLWSKTAASWFGFGRWRLTPIHVGRPRSTSRPPGRAQLHQLRHVDPRDVTEHQGIPIARPELVLRWLAGALTHRWPTRPDIAHDRLAKTVDHAWREGLVDGRYLHELAERTGGRGRSGIVLLREVLATRPPDHLPAGSGTEERFERVLPARLRDQLRRQVSVHDHAPIGVVDYEARPWPLVVEINGEQWHTAFADRLADDQRYERLIALGYSVLVLWQYDVWHDVEVVRSVVEHLLAHPDPVPTLHRPTPAPWDL
jgi:very-short-patch-repair endonuclease